MVNTFLIDTDFRVSASKLDRQRLGKQRVEAQQILSNLEKLTFLANYFSIPVVNRISSREKRVEWVRAVVSTYKNSGIKGILLRGNLIILYLNDMPHKAKYELLFDAKGLAYDAKLVKRVSFDKNGVAYDAKNNVLCKVNNNYYQIISFDRWDNFVLPGDTLITTGFMNHPAVAMWIGYEDALKDYINAHIEAWIDRGYNNTMKLHVVPENYERPSWTYSKSVIADFQASLLHREIERCEPAWYVRQDDFINSWATSAITFKSIVNQLPSNWYQFIDPNYLLSFGSERGLPWS